MKTIVAFFIVLLVTLLAITTQAHYLWIEDIHGHGLTMRFAEWPDEYEKSPGHLDEVDPTAAWKFDASGKPISFQFKKKSDQVQIVGASAKEPVLLEAGFEVMTPAMMQAEGAPVTTNTPSRKPVFYARWQPTSAGAAKPALTFDIVPTCNPGEYQVYFRNEPVPNVKVSAHLPDASEQKLVADEKGIVHFSANKPGLYMLTCQHQRENTKGYSNGIFYDVVSHNCSLTWRQTN